jgi:hypothetical protein
MAKLKLALKLILFNLLVVVLAFLLIEGIASSLVFYRTLENTKPVAERLHTRYDPELGWVNIPNTTLENMYGPGLSVRINAQGFRSDEDFSREIPEGKVRLICSGDSFTFSFGVDNAQTWCHLLSTYNPRLQTVNMGQGGYGIDQAYLWYKRDGDLLEHDINLFAFITADFDRMQRGIFLGYGKPVLKVEIDELIIDNVPVPRQGFILPWTTPRYQAALGELRSVQILRQTFFQNQDSGRPPIDEPEVQAVAEKILEDLVRLNRARGSRLVLVYLPTYSSHRPDPKTDTRRRYIRQGAAANDVILIDLVEDFRKLPEDEIEALFIPNGAIDFPGAAGHYSARGNEYIARRLSEELLARPEIAEMIGPGTD